MRAELKSLISSDIDPDSYYPEDRRVFGFGVQAVIGPENFDGGDVFNFFVCSPDWLKEEILDKEIIFARSFIIINDYNFEIIENKIKELCSKTVSDCWDKIAIQISKFGFWEFEEYKQYEEN